MMQSIFHVLVQFSRSVVSDSVIPWTAACQVSLSVTNSQSLLKLMSIAMQPSHPLSSPSPPNPMNSMKRQNYGDSKKIGRERRVE